MRGAVRRKQVAGALAVRPASPDACRSTDSPGAALRERGINIEMLDNAIGGIFAGRADLYHALVKRLDAFPPGARLQAYLRSAQAVMQFVRLGQYVN